MKIGEKGMPRRKIPKETREKIKELRNKENLTFQEISDKVGLSVGVVYKYAKSRENKKSEKLKCELDITPEEFHSIFREKAQEERGRYLMRPEGGTYVKRLLNNKEDFQYVVEELEKFIEMRE